MNISKNSTLDENKFLLITTILISILPAALLIGTLISNSLLILICLFFLSHCFYKKDFSVFKNKISLILYFFWFGLIINFIFSEIPQNSIGRVFGFVRFLILSISIFYIFNLRNIIFKDIILKSWAILFLIVIVDLLIEFIFGKNILGYSSDYAGRLASFTGDELKIGNFFLAFSFIFIATVYDKIKNIKLLIFLILIIIILGFLIGERANFIRLLLIANLFIFSLCIFKKKIKIFLLTNLAILSIFLSLISYDRIYNYGKKVDTYNDKYYIRYLKEFNRVLDKPFLEYLKYDTRHGHHYYTAVNVFKEFKLTGVGLKNFREFSFEKRFIPKFSDHNKFATHPHQIYFEILSEMGILGLVFFFVTFVTILIHVFRTNLREKSLLGISASSFVLITFLPLIPSGSFFTSFGATLFWMNFGVMCDVSNKSK